MKKISLLLLLLFTFSFSAREDNPFFESKNSAKPEFKVINNNQDSSGASIVIQKTSIVPSDNDTIGTLSIRGNNSSGKQKDFASIEVVATDVTGGSEDSTFTIKTYKAGASTDTLILESGEVTIPTSNLAEINTTVIKAIDANGIELRNSANVKSLKIADDGVIYVSKNIVSDSGLTLSGAISGATSIGCTSLVSSGEVNSAVFKTANGGWYNPTGVLDNTINFEYNNANDYGSGWINYVGYQGGITKFRDFYIGNGKKEAVLSIDGSTGLATFARDVSVSGDMTIDSSLFIAINLYLGGRNYIRDSLSTAKNTYFEGMSDGSFEVWANSNHALDVTSAGGLSVLQSATFAGAVSTQALSATTGTYSGILKTDDTTDATTTTDGSLQTAGGLSVVGNAVIGGDVSIGGSLGIQTVSKTEAYTAANETVILCDATSAAFTITLPAVATDLMYIIKKTDAVSTHNVTIDGNASETVEFELTQTLTTQGDVITIVSDGTQWLAI